MKQLDLLLIHPSGQKASYQNLSHELSALEPPVWALMTAGFILSRGFSVFILDSQASEMDSAAVALAAKQKLPRLIGIAVYGHNPSASTQMMPAVREICASLKSLVPEIPIILFGGHAASLPERTLLEEPVDFVSDGEGPVTILELLNDPKDYSTIPDLWYRTESGLYRAAGSAPLVKNLETHFENLPWELLPMAQYRAHNWHCFGGLSRTPYAALYTTLGCPYHCEFCCIQSPFKKAEKTSGFRDEVSSYRFWNPDWVLAQIDTLVNQYGVRNIKIADEMFVLNRKHVLEICERLIARDYGLNLWAYARVDTAKDPLLLAKLKQAGFNWLALGIESADPKTRNRADKNFVQADIFESVSRIQEAGIHVLGNYIFGLPGETADSMQQTLDLAIELNTEFANFYCAMAYPGSALYEKALKENWKMPADWEGFSQFSVRAQPLSQSILDYKDILDFRDQAFEAYFNRTEYLTMLANKFGPQATEEIRRMMTFQIQRAHVR